MLNLDSMNLEQLEDFIKECNHIRLTAKKYKLTVKDTKHYKNYAWNKITAIHLRIDGFINDALRYERICENIYNGMDVKYW